MIPNQHGYLIFSTENCEIKSPMASLNRGFMKDFMILNIINFADDMVRREMDGVSWDVRRVSSP